MNDIALFPKDDGNNLLEDFFTNRINLVHH